tara:strand:+ start:3786 stop:4874 length:1089 start_codon:yes stop_codon:yes gene_type:complete
MYLKSINNFRGIAIILIVAVHLYIFGFSSEDKISSLIRNTISSGTLLFVFVSGYMFHYIYYKKYNFKSFIIKKIKYVVFPYLFISSIAIIYFIVTSYGYFKPISELNIEEFERVYTQKIFLPSDNKFITILKYYLTGQISVVYWYIPFAILLFLCSPFHLYFVRKNTKIQIIIILISFIISAFVHRSVFNLNPLHSLIYYTPIYLLGIFVSINSKHILKYLNNKLLILILGTIIFSCLQVINGSEGAYTKDIFEYNGIDLQIIQKTFMILFLYIFLERYVINSKIIDKISETSFAIYFLHPWIIYSLKKIYNFIGINYGSSENNILLYLFTLSLVIIISVGSALSIKFLFSKSKYTRYFIGY